MKYDVTTNTINVSDEELTGGFLTERNNGILIRLTLSLKTKTIAVNPTEKNLKAAREHLDRRCKIYNEKRV